MCVAHLSWYSHMCLKFYLNIFIFSLLRRFCWRLNASEQKCLPTFFLPLHFKTTTPFLLVQVYLCKTKNNFEENVMFKVSNIKCAYSTLYYGTAIIATSGSCVLLLATVHYSFYPTTNMPLLRLHDLNHSLSLFSDFKGGS